MSSLTAASATNYVAAAIGTELLKNPIKIIAGLILPETARDPSSHPDPRRPPTRVRGSQAIWEVLSIKHFLVECKSAWRAECLVVNSVAPP